MMDVEVEDSDTYIVSRDILFMLRKFLSETCNFVSLEEAPTGFAPRGTLSAP